MSTRQALLEIKTRLRIVVLCALLGSGAACGGYLHYWVAKAAALQNAPLTVWRYVYAAKVFINPHTQFLQERHDEWIAITAAGAFVGAVCGLGLIRVLRGGGSGGEK